MTVLSTVVMPLRSPLYHWLEKDERSPCFESVVMFVLLGACPEASIPRAGRVCLRGCPQVCSQNAHTRRDETKLKQSTQRLNSMGISGRV